MPTDPLLTRARRAREQMQRVCEEAQVAYRRAVLEAYEAEHIGATELAKAIGVKRQTVYDLVERARKNHQSAGRQTPEQEG